MLAAMCVVVSGLGHAMMSGAEVPAWAMVYAFACVTAGAWWLTGRPRGALALTGATVATQAALHAAFMLGQMMTALPPAAPDNAGGMPGMGALSAAGDAVGVADRLSMTGVAGIPTGHVTHMREWSPGMLAVHFAAAVLCGLWLWRGEVALYRLGRALTSFLTTPLRRARAVRAVLPSPAPAVPVADRRDSPSAEVRLRHLLVRRGPPHAVRLTDWRPSRHPEHPLP